MSARHIPSRISVDDYLQGELLSEVRHEYIDGQVYVMAGAGERHNRIALNAAFQLRGAARGGPCGVFMSDMKVQVRGGDTFYYPDVMLCCDPDDDHERCKRSPCLIVEVLSPSTETTDRREKWLAYRGLEALRYYLLVDSRSRRVGYFVRNPDGVWETAELDPGERLDIDCGDYHAGLSLEQLCEDVRLPPLVDEG
jgi:Uma2 family endonuclease